MKVSLTLKKRSIERLTLNLVIEKDNGESLCKDVDLSGNSTSAALWGATEVVKAMNALLETTE